MPGWELYGDEEQQALFDLFDKSGGIMFAHGFHEQRNGIYKVREFEAEFATHMGVAHAQAVSSGSAALKVALQATGIKPGDEVITSCFTFVATVEAILEVGAVPVLVDIDETLNMDPVATIKAFGGKTKAVLPVHMMGECFDMAELGGSTPFGVPIIEDACQAMGASYKGHLAGTYGQLGCYSFDGGKTLTTGEGGMVVTNDELRWRMARSYHDHGHCYMPNVPRGNDSGFCRGFNYRMTEMQAAVGIAQLRKLDLMITRQRANKRRLVDLLQPMLKRWPMRVGADPKGDAADTLVWFCETRKQADWMVGLMNDAKLATKNLPDALDWHFAERWSRYLQNACKGCYSISSEHLLRRAIAIPIMINWTEGDMMSLAHKLLRASEHVTCTH